MKHARVIGWPCGVWLAVGLVSAPALDVRAELPVTVRTIDQDAVAGELIRFDLEEGLVLRPDTGTVTVTLPAEEVIDVTRGAAALIDPAACCLMLAGGDRLYGQIAGGAEDHLLYDAKLGRAISVPMDAIHACLRPEARTPKWAPSIRRLLQGPPVHDEDRTLLANGDVMQGFIARVSPERIRLERDGQEIDVGLDTVIAMIFAAPTPQAAGQRSAQVRLTDGSSLGVSRLRWTANKLDMTYFDGTLHDLPPDAAIGVEMASRRWTWLTELEPSAWQHTPALSLRWPWRRDRNVAGGPMSIAGRGFQRGIGVHSKARLRFALQGRYQSFRCFAGMDDSAGPAADVSAAIKVDGQTRWQRKNIKAGASAQAIHVDVRGAEALELLVDYGENGDIQDRFNWAAGVLVRP